MVPVSVIVPVYNAEDFLRACAGNLINQTLSGIEIIFIDDASTDKSPMILDALERQFPKQVKVFYQKKNQGPGAARNIGMDMAFGEYIGFVDSDDLADVAMYDILYKAAKKDNLDVVTCSYVDMGINCINTDIPLECEGEITTEQRNCLVSRDGYIWCKIFKKELLKNNNIIFRNAYIMEDTDFMMHVYAAATKIGIVQQPLYQHNKNPKSLMQTVDSIRNYEGTYGAMQGIYHRIDLNGTFSAIREGVEAFVINLYLCGIVSCIDAYQQDYAKCIEELERLRIMKQNIVHGSYDNPYIVSEINRKCIDIMIANDDDPKKLLA